MEYTKSPEYIINKLITNNKLLEAQEIFNKIDKNYILLNKKSFTSFDIKIKIKMGLFSLVLEIIQNKQVKLMKRDYLLYIINIYNLNPFNAVYVFTNYVINNFDILTKDIDLLIDNNCYLVLLSLDGYYFNTSNKNTYFDYTCLKKYNFNFNKRLFICNKIKSKLDNKSFDEFITKITLPYDIIIDGGNILFSYGGTISYKSYNYLLSTLKKFKNPLLIIHRKHFKNNSCKKINTIIKNIYDEYKDNIIKTPYGYNDDWYIIFASIFNQLSIITNDNFKDHIFYFDNDSHFLKNYFAEYILNHNCYSNKIQSIKNYSKCIQVINNNIYIPTKTGYYIYIPIKI